MSPKEKYKENINTLTSIGYPPINILEIEGTTGEGEYFEVFDFYQSNLEYNYKNYKIDPSIWFMQPNASINARAIKANNYFLIGTNKGLIDFLFINFKTNTTLFDNQATLIPYKKFEALLDNPFHFLMYQANLNFTFYHEMGHLLQFSKRGIKSANISEQSSSTGTFNQQRHIDEIDSDTFSCLCTSGHVLQYIKNYFSSNPTNEEMVKIISSITTAISLYLLSFTSYKVKFYLKENTHPHVMIRILNVINVLTDSFVKLAKEKGKKLTASEDEIIKETLLLTKALSTEMKTNINLSIMAETLVEHGATMKEYLNYLSNCAFTDPNSAWSQKNNL